MLIKWSDLEPGDTLKFTEEICEKFKDVRDWYRKFHNKNLIIESVRFEENYIKIYFSNYNYGSYNFCLNEKGIEIFWGFPDVPMFEIVKLRDE